MSFAPAIINRQKPLLQTSSNGSSLFTPIFPNMDLKSCQTQISRSRAIDSGTTTFLYSSPTTPNSSSNRSRSQDNSSINTSVTTSIISTMNWEHFSRIPSTSNSINQPMYPYILSLMTCLPPFCQESSGI